MSKSFAASWRVAAEAGGDEARALAERLTAPLDSVVAPDAARGAVGRRRRDHARARARLRRAAPARGRPRVRRGARRGPPDEPARGAAGARARGGRRSRASTCGCPSSSRPTSSRPPRASGLSVNAWLVRAVAAAVDADDRAAPARRARRPVLPGVGALMPFRDSAADLRDRRAADRRRPAHRRASATTPSSRCARATRPTSRGRRGPPRRPASSSRAAGCTSRRRSSRAWLSRSGGGSIEVTIELPAGSSRRRPAGSWRTSSCDGPARRLPDQDRPRPDPRRASADTLQPASSGAGDIDVERAAGARRPRDRLGRRARRRARPAAP